jgi:hypothetical protein
MLSRDALVTHARRVGFDPGVVYVGDCLYVDDRDREMSPHRGRVHTFLDLVNIPTVWRATARQRGHIVQPEVLFPRQLALDVGGVDARNHLTMDFDLWGRFLLAGAPFRYTQIPFARFRIHGDQKTGQGWATTQSLTATALKLVARAEHLPEADRQSIVTMLHAYEREYWLNSGPLARAGLPASVVLPLRRFYARARRRAADFIGRGSRRNASV